jgi:hypothetical protein
MRSVQVSKANGPFEIVERDIPDPSSYQARGDKTRIVWVSSSISFSKRR